MCNNKPSTNNLFGDRLQKDTKNLKAFETNLITSSFSPEWKSFFVKTGRDVELPKHTKQARSQCYALLPKTTEKPDNLTIPDPGEKRKTEKIIDVSGVKI